MRTESLSFQLSSDHNWPPVAVECLPFAIVPEGHRALTAPLFVKGLSVGDVIAVVLEPGTDRVESWHHVSKSGRTTMWLLDLGDVGTLKDVLQRLRELGCDTVSMDRLGTYAVDIPEAVPIAQVDGVIERLDPKATAVAFPSMRHPE